MKIQEILFFIFVLVYVGAFAFIIPVAITDISKQRKRRLLGTKIANTFFVKPLTKKQIDILASEQFLKPRDVHFLLRHQFSKAIESENDNRDQQINYFQLLYEEMERDQPFEGLPSELRLHLERIREALGTENEALMLPLATQLQELNIANSKSRKFQNWMTVAGFVVGLVGLVPTVIPYLK